MNGHANGNGCINGGASSASSSTTSAGAVGTFRVKAGLAQMLKGGVIMGTFDGGCRVEGEGEGNVMRLRVEALLYVLACRSAELAVSPPGSGDA